MLSYSETMMKPSGDAEPRQGDGAAI